MTIYALILMIFGNEKFTLKVRLVITRSEVLSANFSVFDAFSYPLKAKNLKPVHEGSSIYE